MDKIKPIENNERLCWKCLQEYNNIHKFVFGDLGYGSRFDSFGSQIQLCDKCFEESNPTIWDFEEVDTENICGGHYKYETEIWKYINNLPIESQELFNNVCCFGCDTGWNMESQDWIDYKLGILSHEKCKEYGYYSPQEIKAYEERFPNCDNVYKKIYEDGDISCHCNYGAWGNSDGTCNENISEECYECTHYKPKVNNKNNKDCELIQYIIVNKDLNMSTGKIASQVGHVCTICAVKSIIAASIKFDRWYNGEQKKIILQAHQNVLEKLENDYYSIRDKGYTEIEPNSLTAVSLGIMTREQAEPIVKRLQLLK